MIPDSVRRKENLHIVLWLLKDTCWVADFKTGGMIMILPTIAMAFYITWKTRENITELFHNLAVCCWIIANSIWMTGEFYFKDTTRPYAIAFFVLGLISVFIYYTFIRKQQLQSEENEDRTHLK